MDVEKSSCTCTGCHTEKPATKPVTNNKPNDADIAGGFMLFFLMCLFGWVLLSYLNGDLD